MPIFLDDTRLYSSTTGVSLLYLRCGKKAMSCPQSFQLSAGSLTIFV
jgi:hypothetical protein